MMLRRALSEIREMTLLLSHSFLMLQLLSAAEDLQTKFFEAITKDDLPAVRAFLKQKPELARAENSRGNSALVLAAYLSDSEGVMEKLTGAPVYFYPPAKNQVLHEIMRLAPPADVYEACLVGDLKRARSFLEKNPTQFAKLTRRGRCCTPPPTQGTSSW